jgi:GrpB-like predicted nucleotidyltransferase (UPF0157 family)
LIDHRRSRIVRCPRPPARGDTICAVDRWAAAGLGLDYGQLGFGRTTLEWLALGEELRSKVEDVLDAAAQQVELIGSSSVVGLLAKPILDIAVGASAPGAPIEITRRLVATGWIYRGDAGDAGGHVYVLETTPWHRVAHVHLVEHGGVQWVNYLRLRDLLRRDPEARARYEQVKLRLAAEVDHDRYAYTNGKTAVVAALLDGSARGT